jgi:UDP-N-acetylglucosamine transferase subunit ALG13
MNIFVTVGMNRWPFDRLLEAVKPLCERHALTIQTGPSKIFLPCRTYVFLSFSEFIWEMKMAEVIITHAGNTVRLVQRLGKVPLAMAREARYGEMANDHQVEYLKCESENGLVVPIWDPKILSELVERHMENQAALLSSRFLPPAVCSENVAKTLELLCQKWIN